MLDEAGSTAGTRASQRVFIRGKTREKGSVQNPAKYLAIDLEKDGIDLSPDKINISVDVDSLIWVISANNFKVHCLELYLSPPLVMKTAFDKNNFVYVKLVSPPSNEHELYNPASRTIEVVPLSRIPHLGLEHSGQGERRINFYVFFPRMLWKNEKTRRYATLLPGALQDLWFEEAVLPAYNKIFSSKPGFDEYQPKSLQEIHNKAGRRKQKETNIVGENTIHLVEEIRKSVQNNEILSCFGSFFIVGDGRGMKLTTKQCILPNSSSQDSSPVPSFDFIKSLFPDLDWKTMQDRKKGELYLDVGRGYHSMHDEPLVGLWRIPILQEAFTKMGMKQGDVHNFGTHVAHGGLKAEMKAKMKITSHIVSRLCYCLVFELVRNPGEGEYLCKDEEVVKRSETFLKATQNWVSLVGPATSRSFGVRDEIRGLSGAVLTLLQGSVKEVSNHIHILKSHSILT